MTAEEVLGICKTFVKKTLAAATISTVSVIQNVTSGNQIADINVSGNSTKIYVPAIKVNGTAQIMANNAIDLDVASNLITEAQWAALETIFSIGG